MVISAKAVTWNIFRNCIHDNDLPSTTAKLVTTNRLFADRLTETMCVVALDIPPSTIIRLTGRHKMALMLHRAGYKREVIAEKMGFKHPESVSRFLTQAKAAEQKIRKAAEQFLED